MVSSSSPVIVNIITTVVVNIIITRKLYDY
jgi:hypothetical protein